MIYQSDRLPLEICLGKAGESNVNVVSFDMTPVISSYIVRSVQILAKRPGEDFSYPVATEYIDPVLHWTVSAVDTANEGAGLAEIVVVTEDGTKLSAVTKTKILPSLYSDQQPDPPPVVKPWLEGTLNDISDFTDKAVAAAEKAEHHAESITGMSVRADTLTSGLTATVDWNSESGVLSFGIPEGPQGKTGPRGLKGDEGDKGDPGQGVPPGGTSGQVLAKRGSTDYDTHWIDLPQSGTGPSSGTRVLEQIANGTYQGTDLTVKFASEIAGYANPWEWIRERIRSGDFSGMYTFDYIPFSTTNSLTFQAQILGINTYMGSYIAEIGDHIDFISKELWPNEVKMNLVNINNGTSPEAKVPWLASNGYLFANSLAGQVPNSTTKPYDMIDVDYTEGGMYYYLPDELKEVIVDKYLLAPIRYGDNILKNDNNSNWVSMGKLWLPDEYEITSARLMSTTGFLCGGLVQYPYFAHSMERVKRIHGSNRRATWWLSSALADHSTAFLCVQNYGSVYFGNANSPYFMPFCFRVS